MVLLPFENKENCTLIKIILFYVIYYNKDKPVTALSISFLNSESRYSY